VLSAGAGIAGSSLAFALAAHGSVILPELEGQAQPGYPSTGRWAAMLTKTLAPPPAPVATSSHSRRLTVDECAVHIEDDEPEGAVCSRAH
jgi:flavin-dependent dehydrogenase